MAMFGKRRDEEEYDEEYEVQTPRRKIRDLKPENRKRRKEPVKPWGKKERYVVLVILLVTVLVAVALGISARDFKLPGFPKIKIENPFKEEVIVVGSKKNYSKIASDFKEKTKNLSGTYALYIIDLSNNYSFGVDGEKVMQAASLIKLPVMLYVNGKVDDSNIEAMGKRSDNVVFSQMRSKFGDTALQSYIDELGMKNTSIEKNETTPKEIGDFFKKFKDEPMMEYLVDTIFEDWLPKGIPENIKIAHKYGREVHVVNDAGVVYAEKPYVVVIMTQGVIEKEADEIFPELSKLVYDGMNK